MITSFIGIIVQNHGGERDEGYNLKVVSSNTVKPKYRLRRLLASASDDTCNWNLRKKRESNKLKGIRRCIPPESFCVFSCPVPFHLYISLQGENEISGDAVHSLHDHAFLRIEFLTLESHLLERRRALRWGRAHRWIKEHRGRGRPHASLLLLGRRCPRLVRRIT